MRFLPIDVNACVLNLNSVLRMDIAMGRHHVQMFARMGMIMMIKSNALAY